MDHTADDAAMEPKSPSNITANRGSADKDAKSRQQFTNKQRMDLYAFCVLELELHSNKVSLRKQQIAIEKALAERRGRLMSNKNNYIQLITSQQSSSNPTEPAPSNANQVPTEQVDNGTGNTTSQPPNSTETISSQPPSGQQTESQQQSQDQKQPFKNASQIDLANPNNLDQSIIDKGDPEISTLLELQRQLAVTRKCYSDHQKSQVLTSSMLRDVQKRFAKYYPDSTIPSRTTIKHLFDKCVAYGTVENIKTPRKATKITQRDEIEHLLIHEPQLSLRQMAQRLHVSTGTVSRRCRELGLIPESVTIKHQQMATARRNKQKKELVGEGKPTKTSTRTESNGHKKS